MEATTPETYAVLDGAYWLDPADGDCAPCVHCALLHRSLAPDAPKEPGQGGAAGQEDQDGLLDRLQTALTCGNASRFRAVMVSCAVGTVIVGAAATLRR
ncbi:hypothetical protein ACIPUC_11775 [Streptomyces sp. LARHCF249]